jgi:cytochrome c peroxidase
VIPDPPPGASTSEVPETSEPIETTRQEVELLTGQDGCDGCHQSINPPGFAFENFDAVGQLRTNENGVPVDTSGSFTLDQAEFAFTNAIELVDALATSNEALNCYASKWLQFAYGHNLVEGDQAVLTELGGVPTSVHQLISQVATSDVFLNRKPNEVAP